jgi:CheY-like chemotaxis protein
MERAAKCFRLTQQGQALWRTRQSVPLPLDYRRILGLVEYSGHSNVIRSLLAKLSIHVVDGLLVEFQRLRLIEPVETPSPVPAALRMGNGEVQPIEPEDQAAYDDLASYIDTSLSRLGVYVAIERALHRRGNSKLPGDTSVLVVEDDPDQGALACRRVRAAGYRVQALGCVGALYDHLERQVPDAICLDLDLPDGNGLDVLSRLRRHPSFTFLPMVLLTASKARKDIVKGLLLGADGYVTKSYAPDSLEYVLRYVLTQEIGQREPAEAH